jgi:acyl-CoA reductase-like NAD-dependent aldehyde dehydrogenase
VHDRISARFEELFLQAVRALIVGNPLDENTVVGPMIDEAAAVKVEGWITEAKNAGATVVCGGGRKGAVMEPTVLRDVPSGLHVCTEEVFAPLVVIQTFTEFGDAVRAVNDSRYGLQAGVFSNNLANVLAAYRDLDVGGIVVNDSSSYRMDHMPYGGVKDSGFGREGVRYAIEEMTEPKLLCLRGM